MVRRLQLDIDEKPREEWLKLRPIDPETGERMPAWTPHDLRRTFSTRLGDLGVAPRIIERLLNIRRRAWPVSTTLPSCSRSGSPRRSDGPHSSRSSWRIGERHERQKKQAGVIQNNW
jgi:hypothetical protein